MTRAARALTLEGGREARARAALAGATLVASFALASCSSHAPAVRLTSPATAPTASLDALTRGSALTVLVFFSAHCPCQRAHDERLRELALHYAARGVRFVAVDSEAGATPASDEAEGRSRGYPFSVVTDRGGALADALGAEFATYAVVIDGGHRLRYAGGLDSDKTRLGEGATMYVRDALDDLLAGRPPRVPEAKAFGCVLRRH